jgi:hypothetical protein
MRRSTRVSLVQGALALLLGVCSLGAFTGCASTYEHARNEVRMYNKVIRRDFLNINKTFDYHFMRYDWDDPTL